MTDPSVHGSAQADQNGADNDKAAKSPEAVETRTEADGTLIIQPHGELDGERDAVSFRHLLVHAVRKTRPKELIVNLSDVGTLDAIHVGTLIALCDLADDHRVPVVLANPTVHVRLALTKAGLDPERIRYTRDTVSVETPEAASMS